MRASPKSASRRRWPAMTCAAQVVVERQRAEQLGGVLEILRRELHAGAAERVGTAAAAYASTGTSAAIASTQRHAEAFVLAQRDVDGGVAVVDGELLVRHRAGEDEAVVQAAGTRDISARIIE